jgi:NADPH2:quinone reductase
MKNQQFLAVNVGRLDQQPKLLGRLLARVSALVDSGVIKPQIHAELPLGQAPQAHELLRQRQNIGKVVLIP